jgi:hypothetical protein
MTRSHAWVVCESTGRWTAALRTMFARQLKRRTAGVRLYEVRRLAELAARLDESSSIFGLIEVRRDNFGEVLEFLGRAGQQSKQQFVALLGSDLRLSLGKQAQHGESSPIDAIWEAGAADVIRSPRLLSGLFVWAGCQTASFPIWMDDRVTTDDSIGAHAWAALPWKPKT